MYLDKVMKFDIVVIGGGPAGMMAAIAAAESIATATQGFTLTGAKTIVNESRANVMSVAKNIDY